jgi:DHA2 family multidrug resistance protein-like MFS transporter
MMMAAPRQRAGAAGGMLAVARLTGLTTGATLAALFFRLAQGGAETLALSVAIGLSLLGASVSLMRLARTPSVGKLATGPGAL